MAVIAESVIESVNLRQHYNASPAQVFAAWTNPQALAVWFGPHSHKSEIVKFDAREKGSYEIRMLPIAEDPDCSGDSNQPSVCAGEFVQIVPDKKIVMTFTWIENGAEIGDTLLTIELTEDNGGTELVLLHERLPNKEICDSHNGGWQGTLECLEEYLSGK